MSSARATPNDRSTAVKLPSLIAVCLLTLTGCLRGGQAAASEPSECQQAIVTAAADPTGGFRLGTAAAPFGWSTAVADFDADGRLDFAVVDRVHSSAERYQYDIDVKVSKARAQRLALASPIDAVSVVAEDIDRDHDFDIVITPALTHEVLAVWLNDGSGHFSPASLRDLPSHLSPLRITKSAAPRASADAVVVSRRALPGCSATGDRAAGALAICGDVVRLGSSSTRLILISSLRPRAPPASL